MVRMLVWVTATVLAMTPATAAPVVFFGLNPDPQGTVTGDPLNARNAFFAGLLSGVGTETLETNALGTTPDSFAFAGSSGTISAAFTANAPGPINSVETAATDPFAGRFATSGTQYLLSDSSFTLDFSGPVAAFGFYGTDFGDFNGVVTIALLYAGGGEALFSPVTERQTNGGLLFFGVIDADNPFIGVRFSAAEAGGNPTTDLFGFDDLTIADAGQLVVAPSPGIPEPASWAMMIGGFGMIGAAFRNRRRAQLSPA